MRQITAHRFRWAGTTVGALWAICFFGMPAAGPAADNPPQHVFLPPAASGTALSAQVNAEASYVAAHGDMVASVAWARKVNAEAVALEIENSVEYVNAYFDRRRINRESRAEEDPSYLEREKRIQEVLKRKIEEQYQDVMRGDVTRTLNWLLAELSGPVVAYRYLPADQTLLHSTLDRAISRRDLEQIRLTDGGGKGSQLVFSAAEGKALNSPWPFALRGPECAVACANFEQARNDLVEELRRDGHASYDNQTRLMQEVNAVFLALEEAYPKQRRKDPAEFLNYALARRFLQSTLAGAHRTIALNDSRALAGGLSFKGDSVIGLLQHMYQSGLQFAPGEPGAEAVYRTLFQDLRSLYLKIAENRPAADIQPAPAEAFQGDRRGGK